MASLRQNGPLVAVALLALCVVGSVALSAPNITLVPGIPSENVYMAKPTNPLQPFGVYFQVNASSFPNANAMEFLLTRDTTRAPVQVYWSTIKSFPNPFEHEGNLHFDDQNNGHHFVAPPHSPTMQGMYYFGVYLASGTAAAYFNVMATFYNSTQFAPPPNATISLNTRILATTAKADVPSISASWFTLPRHNYTFYRFPQACGMNILVNDVEYILANAQPFMQITPEEEGAETLTATLTDFDDSIDSFCINVVATRVDFRPTSYLAQTIYFPHQRDGIQPQKVDWKKWRPGTWAEIVLTGILFVGAPIGIIIHRIWISRRRAQKRRAALLAGPTWIN